MDSAAVALASPVSDDRRFWDRLRTRVDTILEDRRVLGPATAGACTVTACFWAFRFFLFSCANVELTRSVSRWQRGVESGRGKRLREDSLMLVHGLDSVAVSLEQLSDTLTNAQKVQFDLILIFLCQLRSIAKLVAI
jgi:hypothetical protein